MTVSGSRIASGPVRNLTAWRMTEDDSPDNGGIGTLSLPTCEIRDRRPYDAS
jgi:hypothetical protein